MIANLKYQGLIAPCGMNCGLCIGHLREKRPCGGCFKKDDENKPKVCRSCVIVNCDLLSETKSGFCFDCEKYPCTRLKNLDKRYRTNYGMSMIENLAFIKNQGLEKFVKNEEEKWKCKTCGSGLSVHRGFCLNCKTETGLKTCIKG
ncbi:DUF3795 domain-containing protein [Marinilabilia sp.]|uniref:DUF3795 domain-containing protein n=1 Tax=Marinilabilia sp. TaxID=2021252 RepID=UPI0025C473EA|nr:DUF3795 domain-containing protein [Marinilabilia sp.]